MLLMNMNLRGHIIEITPTCILLLVPFVIFMVIESFRKNHVLCFSKMLNYQEKKIFLGFSSLFYSYNHKFLIFYARKFSFSSGFWFPYQPSLHGNRSSCPISAVYGCPPHNSASCGLRDCCIRERLCKCCGLDLDICCLFGKQTTDVIFLGAGTPFQPASFTYLQ